MRPCFVILGGVFGGYRCFCLGGFVGLWRYFEDASSVDFARLVGILKVVICFYSASVVVSCE